MSFVYPGILTTDIFNTRTEGSFTFYDINVAHTASSTTQRSPAGSSSSSGNYESKDSDDNGDNDVTKWTVAKRFSDFDSLREKLSELMSAQSFPSFPAKTVLRSADPTFIKERQTQLNAWLTGIAKIVAVANSSEFLGFLRADEHIPFTDLIVPKAIKAITDPQFGINDFVYDEKQLVMFTACEDAFALSRLDTKLTNIKMPWEKKSAITIPLGSFNCWRMDAAHEWKLNTTLFFDCQVSTLCYEPEKHYIILGLENGHVICYIVDENFSEFVLMLELIAHSDRVTGIVYQEEKDVLISCSRDKTIYLYDVGKRLVLASMACGASWISGLAFDPHHSRLFLANYGQQILVIDVAKMPPSVIHTLTGHKASVRCVHYSHKERYLFSGGFDNQTGIWDIPDSITRSRSVGWLSGGPPKKVKSVLFCANMNIVVTGCDDGLMAIWNTAGGLLHVIRAHKYAVVKLSWVMTARVLLSGSSDGKVKFWQFPGQDEEQKNAVA